VATTTIKSTYSLDVETVRTLESIARRWNVSKSEALRRAIRAAADLPAPAQQAGAAEALDALQESMQLDRASARRWEARVRSERRASSRR